MKSNSTDKRRWLALSLIIIGIATFVFARPEAPHDFRESDCILCHVDVTNRPEEIKATFETACEGCHSEMRRGQSHPSNLYPSMPIPADLPLTDGKLTCLTCHYAHAKKKLQMVNNRYFLRRLSRGMYFCIICHEMNEKRHIVLTNVHRSTFEESKSSTRIDAISLTCIECHDTHLSKIPNTLSAGVWRHSSSLNHPVGLAYNSVMIKKSNSFRPAGTFNRKMKLFDGKIGCGTCHSIYSEEHNMLVMDNTGSRLCLECHIK